MTSANDLHLQTKHVPRVPRAAEDRREIYKEISHIL